MRLVLPIAVVLAVGGCAKKDELTVTDAVVRLSPNPQAPSAGYFTVRGGPVADRLVQVSSPVVIRVEMHQSMTDGGGMSAMKPLDGMDVPAHGVAKFEPNGRHLMLFNVNPGIKPGNTILMTWTFASGRQVQGQVPVKTPGEL